MKSLHESLQERDAAAWDAFYEEHVRALYGFVFRLVRGDPQTAADVFQDTWLDAVSHIEQFDPARGELRWWLFGIARRRVALHWRRRLGRGEAAASREEIALEALDGAVAPDEVLDHLERGAVVRASLLALPPERRRVLVDKYVEELSVAQIAARTGKSPKAVESLLSRAREQFRSLLRWYFSDTKGRNEP